MCETSSDEDQEQEEDPQEQEQEELDDQNEQVDSCFTSTSRFWHLYPTLFSWTLTAAPAPLTTRVCSEF